MRLLLISIVVMISAMSGISANRITARLDSAGILMGRTTTLRLQVTQPEGTRGYLPLFRTPNEKGWIGVCGDSVEFRYPHQIDTVKEDKYLKIDYAITVQSFDSGTYRLPEVAFVDGVDTVWSNPLQLNVRPVIGVTAETPIADYANVADPENPSIFDVLPDWVVNYWWILLIVAVVAAATIYLWRRYRKTGSILPKKPEPTPNEVAEAALKSLKEQKLWEQGMEKEYYTDLTDILRKYLYGRFGINAMEMTSRQILAALSANKEIKDKRPMIRQILDMADFVKFAKVRPLPADNVAAFENAYKFVIDTRPVATVEGESADGHSSDKGEGKADVVADKSQIKEGGKK